MNAGGGIHRGKAVSGRPLRFLLARHNGGNGTNIRVAETYSLIPGPHCRSGLWAAEGEEKRSVQLHGPLSIIYSTVCTFQLIIVKKKIKDKKKESGISMQ